VLGGDDRGEEVTPGTVVLWIALEGVLDAVVLLDGTTGEEEPGRELLILLDESRVLLDAMEDDGEGTELGTNGCDEETTRELVAFWRTLDSTLDGVVLLDGAIGEEGPVKELETTLSDGIALLYASEDPDGLRLDRSVVLTTRLGTTVEAEPQSPLVYGYDHGQLPS